MITFTKEQLIASAHARIEFAEMMLAGELEPLKERTWSIELELARIALASLEGEGKLSNLVASQESLGGDFEKVLAENIEELYVPSKSAPPAPVSVPEFAPIAYIFKHPAGRLFWALTDESNKGQSDVMPVYSAPVPAFVPPAIEPDYEVIKGILPTANPDEYACCIAADMWNACRAAMLQGAENAESPPSNSPVIPDGWALVPVEPTMAMLDEFDSIIDHGAEDSKDAWGRLLAAAPQQEA